MNKNELYRIMNKNELYKMMNKNELCRVLNGSEWKGDKYIRYLALVSRKL